ncbi:hypothetical protein Ani05nite_07780 [Amorphoplanes nipponensis]|uniref:Uncharacterized protein n=2 Tax=Actinoplanes nipponensis TaxID=135950 RepID=A0A919JI60_9ACTN|nr:hypothetical protein Ani05nite_07780 [Actinoplanes nipponensis]
MHLISRHVPAAVAVMLACGIALRIALHWRWNTYGALQLPLMIETACAVTVAMAAASPFGEPERAAGRWLPWLRLGVAVALTAIAAGALAAAGTGGAHLAGGAPAVLRNLAGLTGIGLLCAATLRGALAWTGPVAYMMIAVYALYTRWHGPAQSTPWIWPARPPHDLRAALCAALVFAAGAVVVTVRGARDPNDD